jgi:ArsR family transcriptional regulator
MSAHQPEQVQSLKLLPKDALSRTSELFAALGDETRLKILTFLLTGEYTVNQIRDYIGTTLPAISYQLRILRTQDLIRYAKVGREKYFRIADSHVMHLLNDGLAHAANIGLCDGKLTCE